jgi:hypothetical protein
MATPDTYSERVRMPSEARTPSIWESDRGSVWRWRERSASASGHGWSAPATRSGLPIAPAGAAIGATKHWRVT